MSERLPGQVLHALHELLRGFQSADEALAEDPDEVYRALLTVILRLVFVLYAEATSNRYGSLTALYEQMREDAALFPDTMDERYGAWAQLLVLFQMIRNGAPTYQGMLFGPDHARVAAPFVSDGTLYRVLDKLLVLDGERISYRTLDVEHIGSVYETMMGFRLSTASGRAVALQPSAERRRSGSHYTPRTLTEPIVRTTLDPILTRLRGAAGRPPRPALILDLKVCDPAMGSGAFLVEACRQLGDALIEAWHTHREVPAIASDDDEVRFARRLIAQRCLYGVDRNPMAVDLAKVSLWLMAAAQGDALTFLDHALRHGDSLVGLARNQIEAFHWDLEAPGFQAGFESVRVRENVAKMRLLGDLVLAAFFDGENRKQQDRKRNEYASAVASGDAERYRGWLEERRYADTPFAPFHWEIEFPEVFDREDPGFDAIMGNPPFANKNSAAASNLERYADWLKYLHQESHGNADLVAHFFRRAFALLRDGGTIGLIATKTIREGNTRHTGLRWICRHRGEIYAAVRRLKWSGTAAVTVSMVHIMKGPYAGRRRLDDRDVETITAFLFHQGGHDDPARLPASAGKSFQGSIVLGMGFTFDDSDPRHIATSLAEMERLIAKDPRNGEVIFPYIGYAEVADSPTHAHRRYVIDFGERTERECRERWPDLMAIVEAKVRPEREKLTKNAIGRRRAEYWWQYGSRAKDLYASIAGLDRVLVAGSQASSQYAMTFVPRGMVYSSNLSVIAVDTYAAFAALQSRVHEIWARFFMSTLEDRLAYTPTTCFETFPFPENWETHAALQAAGRACYEYRAACLVRRNEGLTKMYNRFHDPGEHGPEMVKLRQLHADMDRAVLDAYGWRDISPASAFLFDYRRKPYRFRWPDELHDEILARLLELNAARAEDALVGMPCAL